MRLLLTLLGLAGSGVLAAVALGSPVAVPPVPTVPSVTVPVPTVSVPLPAPTTPKLPPPPAVTSTPPPPQLTSASVPTATTSVVDPVNTAVERIGAASSGSQAASGAGGGAAGNSGLSGDGRSASAGSRGTNVRSFDTSRTWIGTTGSKRRRTTNLTFVLKRAGRVVITVNQISPACVGIGRFSVAGRAGLNRVLFRGVVRGRRLTPGTYRISIRSPGGRVVRRVILVVVDGSAPTPDELRALRTSDVCPVGASAASASLTSSSAILSDDAAEPSPPQKLRQQPAAAGLAPGHGPNLHSGVLGSSAQQTARALQPALIALLAVAILLLGAASLPREAVPGPRVHDALARHRIELAGLGAAALVAVAVAFLLA
jgi:hypothetical protein